MIFIRHSFIAPAAASAAIVAAAAPIEIVIRT